MIPRWRTWSVILLVAVVTADDSPPGLVTKESEQDLVAEASQTGAQAQKRDAGLSNSYGEPLPPDAYGPPLNVPNDLPHPAPIYGVPDASVFADTPPGAYGPPSPVVFPSQNYDGPPPPVGKHKPIYGPPKFHVPNKPKQTYGPPKPIYGPPKKTYGPPKQSLPKPTYGIPFKPPKLSYPKPIYGAPKPVYGPPKPVYGPPKISYGPPLPSVQNLPDFPVSLPQNLGTVTASIGSIGTGVGSISTFGNFGSLETSVGTSIGTNNDLGLNLPAPIYGTPISSLPVNLKPNFPIPSDTYGPPGHPLGPVGPNDQLVVHEFGSIGHYGPPQPDPNPRPPHPGIPAPPTPPHVLYDGWKPIPGISKPLFTNGQSVHTIQTIQNIGHNVGHIESLDQYGPPPPPPQVQEVTINLDGHSLPDINKDAHFSGAQISSGYSTVHQDALANIDLNAIVGGDSNHIDQSKTVFEAHYTENSVPHSEVTFIQSFPEKIHDTYGAPPLDSLSNGQYPASHRQQGAKGLIPPSGIYGVPPGSQYGAPPKPLPPNLPLPYGSVSGGGHAIHGHTPRHPIKFRDSVPDGLIQQIGQISHHKDTHGIDHLKQGPAYLPPPIREVKDINHNTGNHGFNDVSLSIEPSNLYTLPHSGQPINFQNQPNNLYGSPIDSYSAPLLTVSDHTASGSNSNAVTATVDGTILANLSNLEAAAILKHCPYHEAILKAAKYGEKIPSELASSYVASLSSLGSALQKHSQTLMSPQNSFNTPVEGSESVSYNTKDLATASHTLVHTIVPNQIENEKSSKSSAQKSKSLKDSKDAYKTNSLQFVSDQIYHTSEKIKNLSEETKQLQQKIASSSQQLNLVNGQISQADIPIKNNQATYSVQIQSSNGKNSPTIPHEQLLSEGLLQSILHAIEQPQKDQKQHQTQNFDNFKQEKQTQNFDNFKQEKQSQNSYQAGMSFESFEQGLVLPAGYEPIDRTKKDQDTQSSNVHENKSFKDYHDCDQRADNSVTHTIVVPPPNVDKIQALEDVDNDVAVYFGEDAKNADGHQEPVTEISVATSISENVEKYSKSPEFGEKIKKT